MTERLLSNNRDGDTTVVIGIPGIGKSALVARVVDQVKSQRFEDRVAYVHCSNLHDPVAVVRTCLERIDSKRRIPLTLSLEALQQMSEELIGDQDFLILLDGVEPHMPLGEVVRALRTEHRTAHILITTTATPSVNVAPVSSHLYLNPLESDEVLELFAQYAGLKSAQEFHGRLEYAIEIVEALERHTYALQLMGAYMQGQLNILKGVAEDVQKAERRCRHSWGRRGSHASVGSVDKSCQ